ncbi:hypothetical protein [Phenylobacterium sp. J367]|uniref:hypothetical protein n=1 Tax=Phenylobacterium sp. J367 TaxID=2898435 RepID=UPI0021513990|nr:hypothetical protein [Phenylobacterium sp. J367]MCR5878658.1 hypothetical protein [Phenylobacterium sp. J367]
MVEVLVAVDQHLDGRGIEAERADILDRLPTGDRVAAVDDDQPGPGGQQVGGVVGGADVVEAFPYLERRIGGVLRRRALLGGGAQEKAAAVTATAPQIPKCLRRTTGAPGS